MSLRTYPLISHPAFLRYIEDKEARSKSADHLNPADVPAHRPHLDHIYDIAEFLKISPKYIRSMLLRKSKHYRTFSVNKKSGGERVISSPRTYLKVVQWWILDTILYNEYPEDFVFGFVKGRSFIDNAKAHVGARHIINVDIKNFFPSARVLDVYSVFRGFGYNEKVAIPLTELTTLDEGLPQGAPTSPALSNYILANADKEINALAARHEVKFTRYADDLTFSSKNYISSFLIDEVKGILENYHFSLNDEKTRFMGPNRSKEVTGLVIGETDVCFSREYLNSARGWFHTIALHPIPHAAHFDRVLGTLNLIRSVGGRGSDKVIELGDEAVRKLRFARALLKVQTLT